MRHRIAGSILVNRSPRLRPYEAVQSAASPKKGAPQNPSSSNVGSRLITFAGPCWSACVICLIPWACRLPRGASFQCTIHYTHCTTYTFQKSGNRVPALATREPSRCAREPMCCLEGRRLCSPGSVPCILSSLISGRGKVGFGNFLGRVEDKTSRQPGFGRRTASRIPRQTVAVPLQQNLLDATLLQLETKDWWTACATSSFLGAAVQRIRSYYMRSHLKRRLQTQRGSQRFAVLDSSKKKRSAKHLPHCGIFAMVCIRNHQNCWPPQSLDLKLGLRHRPDCSTLHFGFTMSLVNSCCCRSAFCFLLL